ncbi:MAG: hypothetical protein H0T42_13980 [Deltaproteobacteria bacterium]|nr:hypothetical protein [Deltaproteobacteria bacterium]
MVCFCVNNQLSLPADCRGVIQTSRMAPEDETPSERLVDAYELAQPE